VNDVNYTSYAVELYKPYSEDPDPNGWRIITKASKPVSVIWTGNSKFHVMIWNSDPNVPLLSANFNDPCGSTPNDGETGVYSDIVLNWDDITAASSYDVYFGTSHDAVEDAYRTNPVNVDYDNVDVNNLDPNDPNGSMGLSDGTYYWRVDGVKAGPEVIERGKVLKFTVGGSKASSQNFVIDPNDPNVFGTGPKAIQLQRKDEDDAWLLVDWADVPAGFHLGFGTKSLDRDISPHKCLRRLWAGVIDPNESLGRNTNPYIDPSPDLIQAHPANEMLTNIGELGMVLSRSAYYSDNQPLDPNIDRYDTEETVRIDVSEPNFQGLFNALTVFDPAFYGHDPNEMGIPGRININTAPWFVIAQLPWITNPFLGYAIAKEIVAYRDKIQLSGFDHIGRLGSPGFRSIAGITEVTGMKIYAFGGKDLTKLPDLNPGDEAIDDFEERDVIFARISNLITVRSDVFTAYILVRVGEDGPQKRMIAILDRSEVENSGDRVRIRALHPVHDPR
jgi:hypothetical protein